MDKKKLSWWCRLGLHDFDGWKYQRMSGINLAGHIDYGVERSRRCSECGYADTDYLGLIRDRL